ncbi:hypothetical protein CFOL_v3_28820 [Cephalotus follicularis]|uniref:Protein BIG GRAIN 1-like E n=1 Tax=Cephalotus follicularis TaxID=3775 RepID=A0A1Q3CZ97_CEPFO|nr:hypothetical protein CFOL_v3_28820 [Cephalotus follicularis]
MSITEFPDPDKIYKKFFHRRNDSDELDVFEASRYFSGYNEAEGHNCATCTQKVMREERQAWRGGRLISLEAPVLRNSLPQQSHQVVVVEKQMKQNKCKQPSSPGGRLASFLNSLFNQTSSKKKKSKSIDEEESPGGRRKRRSSISHFRSSSTTDSKSIYFSSSSGFRTPPRYAHTPTKSSKDFKSFSDYKHKVLSLSKNNEHVKSTALQSEFPLDDTKNIDKFKLYDGCSEKNKIMGNMFTEKDKVLVTQDPLESEEFRRFNEVDDGAESDSSSDLFELQNYHLGNIYSSGLPVYESTHMESIKRGAPISNGAL